MSPDAERPSGDRVPSRVLVVDDDPAVAEIVAIHVQRRVEGVEAVAETAPRNALDRVDGDPSIECVISDYRMPGLDGLELHDRVSDRRPDLPFILVTASPTRTLERRASEAGITACIEKDGSTRTFDDLTARVRREAT